MRNELKSATKDGACDHGCLGYSISYKHAPGSTLPGYHDVYCCCFQNASVCPHLKEVGRLSHQLREKSAMPAHLPCIASSGPARGLSGCFASICKEHHSGKSQLAKETSEYRVIQSAPRPDTVL